MAGVWDQYIAAASQRFGVPPQIVRSVIGTESGGRHNATSGRGAGGLMQLMPDTFAELRQRHGLGPDRYDPETNILAGTAYLGQLHKQFGNWPDAFGAYNAGPNRWRGVKAGTRTVPAETAAYIPKVQAGIGPGTIPEATNMATGNFGDVLKRIQTPGWTGAPSEEDLLEQTRMGSLPRPAPPPLPAPPMQNQAGLLGQTDELINRLGGLLGNGTPPQLAVGADAPWYERMAANMAQPGPFQHVLGGIAANLAPMAGWRTGPKVSNAQVLGGLAGGMMEGAQGWRQQQLAERDRQMGDLQNLLKLEQLRTQHQTSRQSMQATYQYADQLEQAGHADLAQAVRGNPTLMDEVVKAQAGQRFDKAGDQTAAVKNALALNLQPGSPAWNDYIRATTIPVGTQVSVGAQEKAEDKAYGEELVKEYAEVTGAGRMSENQLAQLEIARRIPVTTGATAPWFAKVGALAESLGFPKEVLNQYGLGQASDAQAFVGVMNNLVLAKMQAQKGPQTENDAKRIEATLSNLGNTPEAAEFLIKVAQSLAKRDIERARFYDGYRTSKGSLNGAGAAWRDRIQGAPLVGNNPDNGKVVFFDEFVPAMRQANPGATDDEILADWKERYGGEPKRDNAGQAANAGKAIRAVAGTFDAFSQQYLGINPGATFEDIKRAWEAQGGR